MLSVCRINLVFFSLLSLLLACPLYANSFLDCAKIIASVDPKADTVHPAVPASSKPEKFIFKTDKGDPNEIAAYEALLEKNDILAHDTGGMGFTFAAKDKVTGIVHRYKGLFAMYAREPELQVRFQKEIEFAARAGKAGIGPKSELDPATGLLKMEEIPGMDLGKFLEKVLPEMPEKQREEWLANFTVAFSEKLQKLHALGIVHLDLKPNNIMIPTEHNNGRNVFLIDFGLSLETAELSAVQSKLKGFPHGGTPKFQGKKALSGKPGYSDDLESLSNILANMHVGKENVRLRSVFALFGQPITSESNAEKQTQFDHELLASAAAQKKWTEEESRTFWNNFHLRFNERSPGQKIKILFSEPVLTSENGFIERFTSAQLKEMIDAGMKENEWKFDPNSLNGGIKIPLTSPYIFDASGELWKIQQKRENVNFSRLRDLREKLGPVPEELKAKDENKH